MPSTYSTSLRLELQADGENAGTWGQRTNTNLGTLIEQAISGWVTIAISGNTTLTALNGLSDQARNAVINLTNGGVAAPFTVTIPAHSKTYVFDNQSGQTATITGGGTTLAIPTGVRKNVFADTSGNVAEMINAFNETSATIASATTTNIGAAAAGYLFVSGTTAITAFDTVATGWVRTLEFQGILTLTYNATTLILPSAASITTAAGDTAIFRSEGSGNWRCIAYQRADGNPLVVNGGTF